MSQLLQVNWFAKYKEVHRYNKDIKTISVYINLLVFCKTRKKYNKLTCSMRMDSAFQMKEYLKFLPTSLKSTVYFSGLGYYRSFSYCYHCSDIIPRSTCFNVSTPKSIIWWLGKRSTECEVWSENGKKSPRAADGLYQCAPCLHSLAFKCSLSITPSPPHRHLRLSSFIWRTNMSGLKNVSCDAFSIRWSAQHA